MEIILMIAGFTFAAYSVVANDVIQTLGTFLSSNRDKSWWVLWLYTGSILALVLIYGWFFENGDVSYGRLDKISLPDPFRWYYVLPPLILLIITRFGIPVSTTFLILSVFSSSAIIGKMLLKSVTGYLVAMGVGLLVYFVISKSIEKYFIESKPSEADTKWTVLQWISTGFLWTQWLIQDLANIFVFLPRKEELTLQYFVPALILLMGLLAYIFYNRGGNIQKIVTSKTNTTDIRSATIIDFIYGIILLFFKELSNLPMSTTWVFVGLLAGREFAISYQLSINKTSSVLRLVASDFGKVLIGLVVSIILVVLLAQLQA
ncbi:hypothetical protein [Flexithrix dorotheae]|uniref:hypothetical protein n=1 Tax=Flexithrix dorotheae TaxID=70993 RepID=UPI00036C8537|nr:hypothetical protein [Flexithrix dorotheae]